jgi:hypothetical protein
LETVSPELLKEFKDRLHFSHNSEDDNLKRLLSFSITAIKKMVGSVDIDQHEGARELVIERARYAYNESLEYFIDNFSREISTVQLDVALDEIELEADSDATL